MRFELERSGLLLVLTAPSGGGKSAALKKLLALDPKLGYSVSYTSRPPRGNEVDGKNYHFVTRAKFEELAAAGAFYEHAEVHGNLYGTSAETIDRALAEGRDIAMDVDVQGGLNIKRRQPLAVLVFLMPPSMEVLEKRLRGRGSDKEEQIELRMKNAVREIESWAKYDYVVMNEDLDQAVGEVRGIVVAERQRAARNSLKRIP